MLLYQTIPGAVTFNFHGVWDNFPPARPESTQNWGNDPGFIPR
jgi:hypothetical protein